MPIDDENGSAPITEFIHDMQTPLTSIHGFAELLLENKAFTGESREYLQIIMDESERMSEMLKEFSCLNRER